MARRSVSLWCVCAVLSAGSACLAGEERVESKSDATQVVDALATLHQLEADAWLSEVGDAVDRLV